MSITIHVLKEAGPRPTTRPGFRHYLAYLIVFRLWPLRWLHILWHPKFSEDFPLLAAAGYYAFWDEPEDEE